MSHQKSQTPKPIVSCVSRLASTGLKSLITVAPLIASAGPATAADLVHRQLTAHRVFEQTVVLSPNTLYTWETTDLTPGADTVLHLWDPASGRELAYSEDVGTSLRSQISFLNNDSSGHSYRLVMRAYDGSTQGSARLLQNGSTLLDAAPVRGVRVRVPAGSGTSNRTETYAYETALAPNGVTDPLIYGLDCNRRLVARDDDGGVGYNARLEGRDDVCYVVASIWGGPSGAVDLYANDKWSDADCDGLGASLERELETCDGSQDPGCSAVFNLRDSDHDGLADAAEVFGIDDFHHPQHLPRWGANPRHKDVFVEVDYLDLFAQQPVTGDDAEAIQREFARGSASDLRNPDGRDGVAIHLDIGRDPTDPADATLFGDWGGSGAVPDGTYYGTAVRTHRSSVRKGVFHYALAKQGYGGGQAPAPGDYLKWGVQTGNRYVGSFVHELGHNLNLQHYGHRDWGETNFKPNYRSVMNYLFPGASFSQGANTAVLNPAATDEQGGLGQGIDPRYLRNSPFYRSSTGVSSDWDYDQQYSPGFIASVRAPVTFASWRGCYAFGQNVQRLQSGQTAPTSPVLIRHRDRLYAFYVGSDERIHYRQGTIAAAGADWNGSCLGGGRLGDRCMSWSADQVVPTQART